LNHVKISRIGSKNSCYDIIFKEKIINDVYVPGYLNKSTLVTLRGSIEILCNKAQELLFPTVEFLVNHMKKCEKQYILRILVLQKYQV